MIEVIDRNKEIAMMLDLDLHSYNWDVLFNSDWNLLMQSVEFINKLRLDEKTLFLAPFRDEVYNMDLRTPKEKIFISVSDFAKKFNNIK